MKKIILLALLSHQTFLLHSHIFFETSKDIMQAISQLNRIKIPAYLHKEAVKTARNFYRCLKLLPSHSTSDLLTSDLADIYKHLKTSSMYQVPLYTYKTPEHYPLLGKVNGFTTAHGIFLRKPEKNLPIGVLRSRLASAAIHAHNRSCIIQYTLAKAIEEKQIKKETKLQNLIHKTIENSDIPLEKLFSYHRQIALLHAEFYGHQATQCHQCVSEKLEHVATLQRQNTDQKQILKIVHNDLSSKNLVCKYHFDEKIDFTIP